MLVRTQVDIGVFFLPVDEQRRRLLAAGIAARRLARLQREQEALRQLQPVGLLEGFGHRAHGAFAHQDVALGRNILTVNVAAPGAAVRARERGAPALGVDHPDLAHGASGVGGDELIERVPRRDAVCHERETVDGEIGVDPRHCRYRARLGADEGAVAADRRCGGAHGDPQHAGARTAADDGERVQVHGSPPPRRQPTPLPPPPGRSIGAMLSPQRMLSPKAPSGLSRVGIWAMNGRLTCLATA